MEPLKWNHFGKEFPETGFALPSFDIEIGITIFLTTFAADMMSLMISCIAKNTTSAMTTMPFVLIFQLLFSGAMFELGEFAQKGTNLSIAKWSINAFAAQANFNSLPMVTIWNKAQALKGVEYEGMFPVKMVMDYLADGGYNNEITLWMGQNSQRPAFATSLGNIATSWLSLCVFAVLFIVLAAFFLKRVDKDKR